MSSQRYLPISLKEIIELGAAIAHCLHSAAPSSSPKHAIYGLKTFFRITLFLADSLHVLLCWSFCRKAH